MKNLKTGAGRDLKNMRSSGPGARSNPLDIITDASFPDDADAWADARRDESSSYWRRDGTDLLLSIAELVVQSPITPIMSPLQSILGDVDEFLKLCEELKTDRPRSNGS